MKTFLEDQKTLNLLSHSVLMGGFSQKVLFIFYGRLFSEDFVCLFVCFGLSIYLSASISSGFSMVMIDKLLLRAATSGFLFPFSLSLPLSYGQSVFMN